MQVATVMTKSNTFHGTRKYRFTPYVYILTMHSIKKMNQNIKFNMSHPYLEDRIQSRLAVLLSERVGFNTTPWSQCICSLMIA